MPKQYKNYFFFKKKRDFSSEEENLILSSCEKKMYPSHSEYQNLYNNIKSSYNFIQIFNLEMQNQDFEKLVQLSEKKHLQSPKKVLKKTKFKAKKSN